MINLFDSIHRTYEGPSDHLENTFDYFNRSARKDVQIIKNKLEEWFEFVPDSEKLEFKKRFKKSYDSVFYELFLFHLFCKLDFDVTIHPVLQHTEKRPDFLIKKEGVEIYVEAKIATDISEDKLGQKRRIDQLYDSLNVLTLDGFVLNIEEINLKTNRQPSSKKIIQFIKENTSAFNFNKLNSIRENRGLDGLPSYFYSDDDIEFLFSLYPLKESEIDNPENRAIGIYPFKGFVGGAEQSIKKSIITKAKRYGKLDKPFLICINAISERTSELGFDIESAVWGSLMVSVSTNPNHRNESWQHAPDGIFYNKIGNQIENVSGILVNRIFASNIPSSEYWLFKHPFTKNPLNFDLLGLKYNYVKNNSIVKNIGNDLSNILKIGPNWLQSET